MFCYRDKDQLSCLIIHLKQLLPSRRPPRSKIEHVNLDPMVGDEISNENDGDHEAVELDLSVKFNWGNGSMGSFDPHLTSAIPSNPR